MSQVPFKPLSHFFVDHNFLVNADPQSPNIDQESFGPVTFDDNGITKSNEYNTTSVVTGQPNVTVKVYAICDGSVLIQPQSGSTTKINLILKPSPSTSFSPIKIKYFIYRGINIADWINGVNLSASTATSPDLLKKLWQQYIAQVTSDGSAAPTVFPASMVGYDPSNQTDASLIDDYFFKPGDDGSFDVICKKGEHLGYFSDKIGLDVVIDYGDFVLDYETALFGFNLGYARKPRHSFDLNTVTGAVRQKKYKEYIHQFLDAAAFWGWHIGLGEVTLEGATGFIQTAADIDNNILKKFHTRTNLYFYIQAERGRSYNFYNSDPSYKYPTGKISFYFQSNTTPVLVDNETHGWPIVIKEIKQTGLPESFLSFTFEYDFDQSIMYKDLALSVYAIFPRLRRENFIDFDHKYANQQPFVNTTLLPPSQSEATLNIPLTNILLTDLNDANNSNDIYDVISSFYIYSILGNQKLTTKYYDDLWTANVKNIDELAQAGTNAASIIKIQLSNFVSVLFIRNTIVNQKVIFDIGKNSAGAAKKRILYISAIADIHTLFGKSKLYSNNFATTGSAKAIKNHSEYSKFIYNDIDMKVYKGKIVDSIDIPSLSLSNIRDYELKQGFFQLGITESEYNQLIYDNAVVPSPLPSPPHITADCSNMTLHLKELPLSLSENFIKFELGVKFENDNGITEIKFPSSPIYIYTIDSFYFFSKEYAEYQEFFEEFATCEANFRPLPSWMGEYGFDWVRKGDSNLASDSVSPVDRRYENILGHAYTTQTSNIKEQQDGPIYRGTVPFKIEKREFQLYHSEYPAYAVNKPHLQYAAAWLSLYPSFDTNNQNFPKSNPDNSPKCFTEAILNLFIDVTSIPDTLVIVWEKEHIGLTSIIPTDTDVLPDYTENGITFGALEIKKNTQQVYPSSIQVRVKSLKEISSYKSVYVWSTLKGVKRLAGQLCLHPNSQVHRKELSIEFVNCKTDLTTPGTFSSGLDAVNENKMINEITKAFNQALIDPIYSKSDLDISRAQHPDFYQQFSTTTLLITNDNNQKVIWPDETPPPQSLKIHVFLTSLHNVNQSDQMTIFCINEYCGTPSPLNPNNTDLIHATVQDVGIPVVAAFKSGIYKSSVYIYPRVVPHEVAHGFGIYHSFSNHNSYSFKPFHTNNFMDYNNTGSPQPVMIPFSKYQWDNIRNSTVIKREK